MRVYQMPLRVGITRTEEFERKKLASFAVNVGTKCGHGCLYCSTGAILRMHYHFGEVGENPFGTGYAIVDPSAPERVARDAQRMRQRGLIQLCRLTDAWSPEARERHLGRRCLEAILSQPVWTVRVLTKSAAVQDDFDLIEKHRDRVLVGLSITGTGENDDIMAVLEPNASRVRERMQAMRQAALRGLRTYAMFCPLLPGIADAPEQIERLVEFAVQCRVEEIFVEPVNARGPGLRLCQEALEKAGFKSEAEALGRIRNRDHWSEYVVRLVSNIQASVRRRSDISKLRFLLYPSRLLPEHVQRIQQDDAGVIWLGRS
ncbi:MAG: DNA photolyase [Planctomycetes bacterium]|nr:DNA photolyase [Planctomycetota bacterium]